MTALLPRHHIEGYKFVSAAHVAKPNERVIVDSTAGAFTLGLPVTPQGGETFELSEAPGIDQLSTNAVTLVCSPLHTIKGGTDTLIINANDDHVQLTFNAAALDWQAVRTHNGESSSLLTEAARVLLAAGSDANVSGTESLTLAGGRALADLGTDFDSIEFSVIDGSWDNAATGVVVDAETLVSSQAVKISGHGSSGTRYFINGDFSSAADTTITVSTDGGANNYRRFRMYGVKKQFNAISAEDTSVNVTEAGTPLNGSSTREYVLQWNGTEIVNTLSKEKWTIGNIEYIVDHLTRHMTVLGFQNITSTGSVSWTEAFADTDYTFAHDIREAQSERGVLRVDTRSATSITYVLYDETGTGDSGSVVHFAITGRIT